MHTVLPLEVASDPVPILTGRCGEGDWNWLFRQRTWTNAAPPPAPATGFCVVKRCLTKGYSLMSVSSICMRGLHLFWKKKKKNLPSVNKQFYMHPN